MKVGKLFCCWDGNLSVGRFEAMKARGRKLTSLEVYILSMVGQHSASYFFTMNPFGCFALEELQLQLQKEAGSSSFPISSFRGAAIGHIS